MWFQENYDSMKEFKEKLKKLYFGEHLPEKSLLFFWFQDHSFLIWQKFYDFSV